MIGVLDIRCSPAEVPACRSHRAHHFALHGLEQGIPHIENQHLTDVPPAFLEPDALRSRRPRVSDLPAL
jgi:hypothetical protein